MAAKLTRLTHKIATQLHLVAESYTICSSRPQAASPETFGYTLIHTHTHTHTHTHEERELQILQLSAT
jgi:hypothetical protein